MRILLSNDDGIQAPGINCLRSVLETVGEVTVVAPDRPRSATGLGITIHKPLRAEEVKFADSNVTAFAINGTPSDCVKLGIQVLMPEKPDIVVSGINLGPNLGTDVLYSGTVSAALEGVINGVPAVAVSLASWDSQDFDFAARFISKFLSIVLEKGLPDETLLNVNVPVVKNGKKPSKVSITRLGKRRYENTFEKRYDPRGKVYYWMGGKVLDIHAAPGTDISAIKKGEISITPLLFDVTDHEFMKSLSLWDLENLL